MDIESIRELASEGRGEDYRFPEITIPEKLRQVAPERLLKHLGIIVAKLERPRATASYSDVRQKYVAINLLFNEAGFIAPRFRPSLHVHYRPGTQISTDAALLSNDHQVLDMHWLLFNGDFQGDRHKILPARWKALYPDDLDIELANLFVGTVGTAETKAEVLGLSTSEELQLRVIQSERVRKWWERTDRERPGVMTALLHASASRPQLQGRQEQWANVWLAARCAGYTRKPAPEWYGLITGKPIAGSTLSTIKAKLKRLDLLS